jgi:ribosome-associated protein
MKNQHASLNAIAQAIFDKKGFNILGLDVRHISTLTDFFIIAEGNVDRHVRAMGSSITSKMKENGIMPLHVEGEQSGDWIVIDYGEIVIHLFTPELREKYAIEQLWHEGKLVDLKIEVHANDKGDEWGYE